MTAASRINSTPSSKVRSLASPAPQNISQCVSDFDARSETIAQRIQSNQANQSGQSLQLKERQTQMATSPGAVQMQAMASRMKQAEQALQRPAEPPQKSKLPFQLQAGIESLSGLNMDHVKVHYNSSQPAQLNAHAYAQGTDIHVAPGQEQHLPHEAWHVVQQAQGRVKPTTQMKQTGAGTIQRRVADPTGLAAATPEVIDGARRSLVETLIDIRRTAPDGPDWIDNTLLLPGDRGAITNLIAALSVPDLILKIGEVRTKYPAEQFDSTNFDVKPTGGTQEDAYIQALLAATILKMTAAEGRNADLLNVFGDGDVTSGASIAAAATASGKIAAARAKLTGFNNIFIDTAGVAPRVGIGGYANFNRKIFLLVQDVNQIPPSSGAVSTLFHETMHLTHSEILDDGGYSSSGASFRQRSVAAKLTNADHYAEIAKIIDGTSTHPVPFTPVVVGGAVATPTNPSDTAATMAVRSNVMHRGRLVWCCGCVYDGGKKQAHLV